METKPQYQNRIGLKMNEIKGCTKLLSDKEEGKFDCFKLYQLYRLSRSVHLKNATTKFKSE